MSSRNEDRDRVKIAQTKFKGAYRKMMDRIENATRSKWLFAIETYYNMADGETRWKNLTEDTKRNIECARDEDLKYLCKELCGEAINRRYINRDIVNWVSTGKEGELGRTLYRSLV